MPRSNPHARERVMDDRKHLDSFARSCPSRGAKRRAGLRLVRRAGALSKLPRAQSVTKRCSRRRRVGALLLLSSWQELLDSGLSARADDERRPQGRRKSSTARLALPPARSNTDVGNRSDGNKPVVLSGGESHSGPAAIRRRRSGPCACTACRSQRGTNLSKGSCSRSYRRGRSRTNGVVVVDARSTGRPGRRAEAKRSGGQPSRRECSPVRWKALWIISTCGVRHGTSQAGGLATFSQTPLTAGEGVSSCRRKPARKRDASEDRRSAVKGASEDVARSTAWEENARVEKWKPTRPKCVGRRETRHASVGPRNGTSQEALG